MKDNQINHNQADQPNQAITETIAKIITDFVLNYPAENHTETSWREPVVGFADAADPMFLELKQIIGPSHALPSEILPGARSVIAYFIPFSKEIVKSNISKDESSREWDYANLETNFLLSDLNQILHEKLGMLGYHSSLLPPTYNYNEEELVSDWSHKSAAYVAGLGRFGVHHLLITDRGCCGRIGSIITD
ncbi:MAG: epoxyqueuosine reductase, partial [Lachnospiraceae bacterium]|nr:epoxyqueuosine reductase [Lachnospiraceae bacterium]